MPTTTFNPYNPFSYWTLPYGGRVTTKPTFPTQPKPAAGEPISIKPRSSDPGMSMTAGRDSVTLKGTTAGPKVVDGYLGGYEVARGLSFTLDIEKAPTTDSFGRTNYTEKNSRIFTWDSNKGQSALHVAEGLAKKVNAGDDFRATVKRNADGSVTIAFARR
ncbi:MAG: hypothetical protein SFW67_19040 [Myxococcaceae bacterium]|nr:hypothetical protein [Myxococcaceae bacterium]